MKLAQMEQPVMAVAEEEYRTAFHDFSEQVHRVQDLMSQAGVSQSVRDAAVIDLERAHCAYKQRRDALAQFMLPPPLVFRAGSC